MINQKCIIIMLMFGLFLQKYSFASEISELSTQQLSQNILGYHERVKETKKAILEEIFSDNDRFPTIQTKLDTINRALKYYNDNIEKSGQFKVMIGALQSYKQELKESNILPAIAKIKQKLGDNPTIDNLKNSKRDALISLLDTRSNALNQMIIDLYIKEFYVSLKITPQSKDPHYITNILENSIKTLKNSEFYRILEKEQTHKQKKASIETELNNIEQKMNEEKSLKIAKIDALKVENKNIEKELLELNNILSSLYYIFRPELYEQKIQKLKQKLQQNYEKITQLNSEWYFYLQNYKKRNKLAFNKIAKINWSFAEYTLSEIKFLHYKAFKSVLFNLKKALTIYTEFVNDTILNMDTLNKSSVLDLFTNHSIFYALLFYGSKTLNLFTTPMDLTKYFDF